MLILFVLLPLAYAHPFILNHINNNLNLKIDVCDNFYDHVCSNVVDDPARQFKQVQAMKIKQIIGGFRSKDIADIEKKAKNNTTMIGSTERLAEWCNRANSFEMLDILSFVARQFGSKFEEGKGCLARAQTVLAALYSIQADLKQSKKWMQKMDVAVAFAEMKEKYFKEDDVRMKDLYATMRVAIIDNIKSSISLTSKGLSAFLEKTLGNVTLHGLEILEEYRTKLIGVIKSFDYCYQNLPFIRSVEVHACIAYALMKQFDFKNMHERFLYRLLKGNKLTTYNGAYYPDYFVNFISPINYYELQQFDELTLLSSVGMIVAHELSHPILQNSSTIKGCIAKTMQQGCEMFFDKEQCVSGSLTETEDAPDFTAIRAVLDLVGRDPQKMQITNSHLSKKLTAHQLFFYAHTTMACKKLKTKSTQSDGSLDPHSMRSVRINAIFRHFNEFKEAFGCKAGDRMVLEKVDQCHLTGPNSLMPKKSDFRFS